MKVAWMPMDDDRWGQKRRTRLWGLALVLLVLTSLVLVFMFGHNEETRALLSDFFPAAEDVETVTEPTSNLYSDRAAVIIETRALPNLVPVILHFSAVLGSRWPVVLYTTPETAETIAMSAPFAELVGSERVSIRMLQNSTTFESHSSVSDFLRQPWIWEELAPYEKLLLFQPDSIICSASTARVDDFLEWDFIGAPIDHQHGQGYNGGLSIRNREMMLRILQEPPATDNEIVWSAVSFEDQWYVAQMEHLAPLEDGSPGAKLPDYEVAKHFAVETIWYDRPLGYHQPHRWQKDHMDEIMKWCPEIGMIAGAAFFDD